VFKCSIALVACLLSFSLFALKARKISSGKSDCFPEKTKNIHSDHISCEVSAVLFDGKKLFFGNDQFGYQSPFSSVFSTHLKSGNFLSPFPYKYWSEPLFVSSHKYEEFSLTVDKKFAFAMTGFDRIKSDHRENHFNRLLAWPVGQENKVHIVGSSGSFKNDYSDLLRKGIGRVIGNPEYFKIEGLTAIPGDRLLFAIREKGKHFSDFEYVIEIVSVSYAIKNNQVTIGDDFKFEYKKSSHIKKHRYGLSSLQWSSRFQTLLIMATYEDEVTQQLGAELWSLKLEDLASQKDPIPVTSIRSKHIISFLNKAEGMTFLSDDTLMIVHDNDKSIRKNYPKEREYHQFLYDVIKLQN